MYQVVSDAAQHSIIPKPSYALGYTQRWVLVALEGPKSSTDGHLETMVATAGYSWQPG